MSTDTGPKLRDARTGVAIDPRERMNMHWRAVLDPHESLDVDHLARTILEIQGDAERRGARAAIEAAKAVVRQWWADGAPASLDELCHRLDALLGDEK